MAAVRERKYRVVYCGRIVACPESDCREGAIEMELPGRFSTVPCPTCSGRSWVVVDGQIDMKSLGRVGGASA